MGVDKIYSKKHLGGRNWPASGEGNLCSVKGKCSVLLVVGSELNGGAGTWEPKT